MRVITKRQAQLNREKGSVEFQFQGHTTDHGVRVVINLVAVEKSQGYKTDFMHKRFTYLDVHQQKDGGPFVRIMLSNDNDGWNELIKLGFALPQWKETGLGMKEERTAA